MPDLPRIGDRYSAVVFKGEEILVGQSGNLGGVDIFEFAGRVVHYVRIAVDC